MSAAKKRQYHDPTLEELLRDMPDDSCAVRDYGAMVNEIARLEDRVRELGGQLDAVHEDLSLLQDEIRDIME